MSSTVFGNSQSIEDLNRGNTGVTDSSKKYANVLIILGSPKAAGSTYETKSTEGETIYSGFTYTLWKRIKEGLSDNYEFNEEFRKVLNYGKLVDELVANKYDIVVGLFYRTPERLEKINFTTPIVLSQNSILTLDKINYVERLMITMKDLLLGPMIFLLVMSIIFGFFIYKLEPNRGEFIDQVKNSKFKMSQKNLSYRRSFMTTVAAFFGEMGFLAENTTLGNKGLVLVIFVMILAFNFVLVLQAQATTFDSELQKRGVMNRENIKEKSLLCIKGQAVGKKCERFGANIVYKKDMNLEKLIEYYKENKDQFNGIVVDSTSGIFYQEDKLNLETAGFGQQMTSFAVSKSSLGLLKDVNKEILKLQDSLEQERICRAFFSEDDAKSLCNV